MGQYFITVNTTKKEFLHPHCFGDGLKLSEFGTSALGVMTGLSLLLRQSTDSEFSEVLVWSWANDQITIVGDYDESKLYDEAYNNYKNISHSVIELMEQDPWIKSAREDLPGYLSCSCEGYKKTLLATHSFNKTYGTGE